MLFSLDELWEEYNSDDSFLSFYIPGIFWASAFLYSKYHQFDYSKWISLLLFHHIAAMFLAGLSLLEYINERIPVLFSMGYFICDLVDCIGRRDHQYALHASICLVLYVLGFLNPVVMQLRMGSKSLFFELSTPFLYLAKRTRDPWHFALFWFTFTCCRIIWNMCMYLETLDHFQYYHPIPMGALFLYLLNVWWYYKIICIMLKNFRDSGKNKEKKS